MLFHVFVVCTDWNGRMSGQRKTGQLGIWAGIFKQSMGSRNQVGIGLSYRPARLHRLAGIDSLESIPGLLKSLKIRALVSTLSTVRKEGLATSLNLRSPFPTLNTELEPLFGLLCTTVLIGWDPATPHLPPHFGSCTKELLVSQDRRHLFATPWSFHGWENIRGKFYCLIEILVTWSQKDLAKP